MLSLCAVSLSYPFSSIAFASSLICFLARIVIIFSNDVIFNAFKVCANAVYRTRVIPVVMAAQHSLCFFFTHTSRIVISSRCCSHARTSLSPVNTPVHTDCELQIQQSHIDEHSTNFTMAIHNHKSIKSHTGNRERIFPMEWVMCMLGCVRLKKEDSIRCVLHFGIDLNICAVYTYAYVCEPTETI